MGGEKEVKVVPDEETVMERKTNYQTVVITEVTPELRFFIQKVDQGPALEQLMTQLRQEMDTNPPLAGSYTCPRGTRPNLGGPAGSVTEGEPFGDEALLFTKENCLQRQVEIEVESMDKGGNFIGWLWIDNHNHSVKLVEEGLASVHFSAERSSHFRSLSMAEESAKGKKIRMWKNYSGEKEVKVVPDEETVAERKTNYQTVVITEVTPELHCFVQKVDQGPALEQLMSQLRQELE